MPRFRDRLAIVAAQLDTPKLLYLRAFVEYLRTVDPDEQPERCLLRTLSPVPLHMLEGPSAEKLLRYTESVLEHAGPLDLEELCRPYGGLAALGDALGLDIGQQAMLLLLTLIKRARSWRRLAAAFSVADSTEAAHIIARILGLPDEYGTEVLSSQSPLVVSGLIEPGGFGSELGDFYELLDIVDLAFLSGTENWSRRAFGVTTAVPREDEPELEFSHIRQDVDIILRTLRGALQKRQRGVHILLYGPSGTGKTSLARWIGRELGATLYEVPFSHGQGKADEGMERFRYYRLNQWIMGAKPGALFLFDEAEDLLPSHIGWFFRSSGAHYKGWLNSTLEETPAPSIWTANSIDHIDPAHLRRFTCLVRVPVPPSAVRLKLLRKALGEHAPSGNWLERLSRHQALSPAHIVSLGRVARSLAVSGKPGSDAIQRVLESNLRAMGLPPLPVSGQPDGLVYSLDYVNASRPLEPLVSGIGRNPTARMCLAGPPGTGKTAFARHLAERVGRPLLVKRASEILSPWVGMTESNIAAMFEEAEQEEAVLLLDEADSFLQDRRHARHSWEVTQVNELLVAMERFPGTFIACTNLQDRFDPASLRRFDLRIDFRPLRPEQVRQAALQLLSAGGLPEEELPAEVARRLGSLRGLAIGDFATVLRRFCVLGQSLTAESLLEALEEEARAKEQHGSRPVGFLASIV